MPPLNIKIVLMDESSFTITAPSTSTVLQLKQLIQTQKGIDHRTISLFTLGRQINDYEELSTCITTDMQVVHLAIVKPHSNPVDAKLQIANDHLLNLKKINNAQCPIFNVDIECNDANDSQLEKLGKYLLKFSMEAEKLVTNMQKAGELLAREGSIRDQQDRQDLEDGCHITGNGMHELIYSASHIAHLIKDVKLGNSSTNIQIIDNPSPLLSKIVNKQTEENKIEVDPNQMRRALDSAGNIFTSLNTVYQQTTGTQNVPPNQKTGVGYLLSSADKAIKQLSTANLQSDTVKSISDKIDGDKTIFDQISDDLFGDLTVVEMFNLFMGNFTEEVRKMLPAMRKTILKYCPALVQIDGRKSASEKVTEYITQKLIIPAEIQSKLRVGYQLTAQINATISTLIIEVPPIVFIEKPDTHVLLINKLKDVFLNFMNSLYDGFQHDIGAALNFVKEAFKSIAISLAIQQNQMMMFDIVNNFLTKILFDYYIAQRQKGKHIPTDFIPSEENAFIDMIRSKASVAICNQKPKSRSYKETGIFYSDMANLLHNRVSLTATSLDEITRNILAEEKLEQFYMSNELIDQYNSIVLLVIVKKVKNDTDYVAGKHPALDHLIQNM